MEKLKKALYKNIDLYGLQDKRTLEVSEKLNKLVTKEQLNRWIKKLGI
ncbi:MAG: Spo0E family sporulation regulatory protein-aspartic acid phosphatase [Clostridium sp.]